MGVDAVVVGAAAVADVVVACVAEARLLQSAEVELVVRQLQRRRLLHLKTAADFGRWSLLQRQQRPQPIEHDRRPPNGYGSGPLRHCAQSGTGVHTDRSPHCGTYGTARSCTLDDAGDCAVPACRARTGTCHRTYTHPLPRTVGTARFCISRY